MGGSVSWWELLTPQTPKGYAEAWARIEGSKLEYLPLSTEGKYAAARALAALEALRRGQAPSPEFHWRTVRRCRSCKAGCVFVGCSYCERLEIGRRF